MSAKVETSSIPSIKGGWKRRYEEQERAIKVKFIRKMKDNVKKWLGIRLKGMVDQRFDDWWEGHRYRRSLGTEEGVGKREEESIMVLPVPIISRKSREQNEKVNEVVISSGPTPSGHSRVSGYENQNVTSSSSVQRNLKDHF